MSGNATVQSFLVTSPKMMDCPFGTAILLAGPTDEAPELAHSQLAELVGGVPAEVAF
jgi:hypothetical protein